VLGKLCGPRMNLSAHLLCRQTPGPMCKASMPRTNQPYVSGEPTLTALLESGSIPRHSRCYLLISKRKLTPRYLSKRRLSQRGATSAMLRSPLARFVLKLVCTSAGGQPSFVAAGRSTESINVVNGFPVSSRNTRNSLADMKANIGALVRPIQCSRVGENDVLVSPSWPSEGHTSVKSSRSFTTIPRARLPQATNTCRYNCFSQRAAKCSFV
jgi:hypothetical protein